MSVENVKKLLEKLETDVALQKKIGELTQENQNEAIDKALTIAKEMGLPFTKDEWLQVMMGMTDFKDEELSDEELESVAGGKNEDRYQKKGQNGKFFSGSMSVPKVCKSADCNNYKILGKNIEF